MLVGTACAVGASQTHMDFGALVPSGWCARSSSNLNGEIKHCSGPCPRTFPHQQESKKCVDSLAGPACSSDRDCLDHGNLTLLASPSQTSPPPSVPAIPTVPSWTSQPAWPSQASQPSRPSQPSRCWSMTLMQDTSLTLIRSQRFWSLTADSAPKILTCNLLLHTRRWWKSPKERAYRKALGREGSWLTAWLTDEVDRLVTLIHWLGDCLTNVNPWLADWLTAFQWPTQCRSACGDASFGHGMERGPNFFGPSLALALLKQKLLACRPKPQYMGPRLGFKNQQKELQKSRSSCILVSHDHVSMLFRSWKGRSQNTTMEVSRC